MQQISLPKKIVGIHSGYHKTASDNKMIFVKFYSILFITHVHKDTIQVAHFNSNIQTFLIYYTT